MGIFKWINERGPKTISFIGVLLAYFVAGWVLFRVEMPKCYMELTSLLALVFPLLGVLWAMINTLIHVIRNARRDPENSRDWATPSNRREP